MSMPTPKAIALGSLLLLPVAVYAGYTFGGMLYLAVGFAVYRWWAAKAPDGQRKQPYRSPRHGG